MVGGMYVGYFRNMLFLSILVFGAAYLLARIVIGTLLLRVLHELNDVIRRGQHLLDKHGRSMGELRNAGVLDTLEELQAQGGKLYRFAVPLAAFLLWWPVGPRIRKKHLIKVAGKAGIFSEGTEGSMEAWRDLCRGFAIDTGYYPVGHLRGLHAALNTISYFGW